jgi:hypothetical protein
MRTPAKLLAATAALTLGLASAALASGPSTTHGRSGSAPGHNRSQQTSSTSTSTTGTSTGTAPNSNAKAFGRLCQGESKKHVAGQKGTPFSKCVTDMAHLAQSSQTSTGSQTKTGSQTTPNPARACANESKKHVAGQKGTPFSQCVSAAAKLLGQQNGQSGGSDQTSTGSEDTTTDGS